MSIIYQLQTAAFPDDYAELLVESLAITPANFLNIKDILYHFRFLEDGQAFEAMQRIAEIAEPAVPRRGSDRVGESSASAIPGNFKAPWCLQFERDGTEDVGVILDAGDDEIVRSRHFWLPVAADPVPPTIAALRLMAAAPDLLAACWMVVARWERGDLAEAARACQSAVELATADGPPWDVTDNRTAGVEPYSVLLLYPDYANDSGTETYYEFVSACDATQAVAAAQRLAASAQEGIDIEPGDFAPLLVTKGRHSSEPLFNK